MDWAVGVGGWDLECIVFAPLGFALCFTAASPFLASGPLVQRLDAAKKNRQLAFFGKLPPSPYAIPRSKVRILVFLLFVMLIF